MTHKEEIKENIKRLKYTISLKNTFNPGYIRNCENQLKFYQERLNQIN